MTSTAYSRDLGDELRRLRQRCTGLRGRGLAHRLGWDPSKVSTLEHGKLRASEVDLAQYVTACGKDTGYLEDFLRRYRHAFDPYVVQAPDEVRTIAMSEAVATKITAYDVMTVHPLLRTPAYAEALHVATGRAPREDCEAGLRLRVDRQSVLRRPNRPECLFYLHERALDTVLGDAGVMEDQYRALLADSKIVRIVPSGSTAAALHPSCALLEFENAPPVLCAESDLATLFAQDEEAVERGRALFDLLESLALTEAQSRRRISEHLSALRREQGAQVHTLVTHQL
ncbi:Helix-turn-helix domain-containing protein [Lentzea xinjiangensis]|uniref:Helix-turn-helix domain-containing protein n=1 Tax=Lentzea xinjiangensis TaxID=402600 RepID=A0A1H9VM14_9PSEU|nr:helix-turn-helix transcriptional regulator [Lentzea xinjiangensis]SES22735.1 Helix-turn-helix domain-containing protein [Lentzea xinjiangensis]